MRMRIPLNSARTGTVLDRSEFLHRIGAHLIALDQPELRKLLLNAIAWTTGIEVPKGGIRSGMPDGAKKIAYEMHRASRKAITEAIVTRPAKDKVVDYPWVISPGMSRENSKTPTR
jgi:hypothetical protein